MKTNKTPPASRARGGRGSLQRGVLAMIAVGVAWACACNWALDPLRGNLEGRLIVRTWPNLSARTDDVAQFVEASEKAIRRHSPDDAELHAVLADLATRGAETTTDPVERLNLMDKALCLRKRAARLEPVNAYRPLEVAMDYLRLGRVDLALVQADRACRLVPTDPWMRAYLAEDFAAYGRHDVASRYLRRAERLAAENGIDEATPAIEEARKALELAAAH